MTIRNKFLTCSLVSIFAFTSCNDSGGLKNQTEVTKPLAGSRPSIVHLMDIMPPDWVSRFKAGDGFKSTSSSGGYSSSHNIDDRFAYSQFFEDSKDGDVVKCIVFSKGFHAGAMEMAIRENLISIPFKSQEIYVCARDMHLIPIQLGDDEFKDFIKEHFSLISDGDFTSGKYFQSKILPVLISEEGKPLKLIPTLTKLGPPPMKPTIIDHSKSKP